ncbi:MAG: sigma 54-interacting transcriptional regulator [Solirubrobacterales bacterium]|jgi:transcriptional regulator with GAF, ATPase, and Fis domain
MSPLTLAMAAPVLSAIARTAAETLALPEVFTRVAVSASALLPFHRMGLSRRDGPDDLVVLALAGDAPAVVTGERLRILDLSPALRPGPTRVRRIDDSVRELDVSFALDRRVVEQGARSILLAPILRGEETVGSVWFASHEPGAFAAEHEPLVEAIAAILGSALEHERLALLEVARLRRMDALDQLLFTLADSLDVRDVFERISAVARVVLPHDRLLLTSLREDGRSARIEAMTGDAPPDLPESIELSSRDLSRREHDSEMIRDVRSDLDPATPRARWLASLGVRAVLRVPVRLLGAISGSLSVLAREPGTFVEADVEVVRRLADHIALALSHQRLAEEARRTADALAHAERLSERVRSLSEELLTRSGYRRVVGRSAPWKEVLDQAAKVAETETTVLLTGESGTGKEVVARLIHRASPRAAAPFVALNCAALPEALLESELFGHEKGAFTGADRERAGRIEQAAGGVLLLDEVGEMSPAVQAKFLRVLQEREFQRLGGSRVIKADVRVIAATNRDLEAAMARGEFREDLYYRLRVFEIRLPPLRDRREDVLPLAEAFLEEIGAAMGRPAAGISKEARERLLAYPWPGNARELRNALERAMILAAGGLITAEQLPGPSSREAGRIPLEALASTEARGGSSVLSGDLPEGGVNLEALERTLVEKSLARARGNRSQAARLLGLTRSQLYTRLRRYGLGEDEDGP